jgi:hypothetical protein
MQLVNNFEFMVFIFSVTLCLLLSHCRLLCFQVTHKFTNIFKINKKIIIYHQSVEIQFVILFQNFVMCILNYMHAQM